MSPTRHARRGVVAFAALGVGFTIDPDHHPAAGVLIDLLRDMQVSTPLRGTSALRVESLPFRRADGPLPLLRVRLGASELVGSVVEGSLVSHLLIELNRLAARSVPLAVHASAATLDGKTVLLPGASLSGKTTLATTLAVTGGELLTDEVAALGDDTTTVVRYGKPVALRPASVTLLADRIARLGTPGSPYETDERFVPPSLLGHPSSADEPTVAIGAVMFPQYLDAARTTLTPLSPAAALVMLMGATMRPDGDATTRFRSLERLARSVPAATLVYGDAFEAARTIRSFLQLL
ncbi:MAG: hypothetical protein WCC60_19725 [Ilumatobacteraceae bacterium]